MNEKKKIKDRLTPDKAGEFISGIESFTDELPDNVIYDFKSRLRYSANLFPEVLDSSRKSNVRKEKLVNMIKARAVLDECRDYISLIKTLKFHNTDKISDLIDELYFILKKDHSEIIG